MGGKRAYTSRLGKGRSARESSHSIGVRNTLYGPEQKFRRACRPAALDAIEALNLGVRRERYSTRTRIARRATPLELGHSPQALIATLAHAVLREDAGFHAYQILEAGVRQFAVWGDAEEGRHILIAVARYLAAHSPTERAALQTADIARRLMRGGELHESVKAS